jgi:hypothetical protein
MLIPMDGRTSAESGQAVSGNGDGPIFRDAYPSLISFGGEYSLSGFSFFEPPAE